MQLLGISDSRFSDDDSDNNDEEAHIYDIAHERNENWST